MMAKIVYIDQEDGKKRVMNNAKLYAKLLTKFKDETQIEPIFAALDAGNYEEAQGLAHTLKGVTANLSIMELHAKVVELEAQIKAKSVSPGAIEAVRAAFAATLPELEKVIQENG
ncbi:MAG: Hpt domain-containing protein [Spirochaetaceae bacterium]|jgi:HPt (histidine-containing phosphotransfer) domain-containing protein|nr:Hpt domain-containing protein [Spirochaetaceae bacterium]